MPAGRPTEKTEKTEKTSNNLGGAREGAGRKKGGKNKLTLEKEKVLEKYQKRLMGAIDKLYNAQFSIAIGSTYLFRKETKVNKKGKEYDVTELVTDPEEIKAYLDGEFKDERDLYYFITTKDPDNRAIDSMMDRTFGKATQTTELTGKNGDPINITVVDKFD